MRGPLADLNRASRRGAKLTAMTAADPLASAPLILLVDDNADARDVMGMLLDHKGYRVACAANVSDAMGHIQQQIPAAIVTDLSMPGFSGLDFADVLRQTSATAHIPIIAVSGHTQDDVRQRALAAGITHFFAKPIVDLDGFMRTLASVTAQ